MRRLEASVLKHLIRKYGGSAHLNWFDSLQVNESFIPPFMRTMNDARVAAELITLHQNVLCFRRPRQHCHSLCDLDTGPFVIIIFASQEQTLDCNNA